jgi:hypothetical protein
MHGHKLVLTKIALNFVSPGGVKMGGLLITCEERDNYLTSITRAICALLTTSAN